MENLIWRLLTYRILDGWDGSSPIMLRIPNLGIQTRAKRWFDPTQAATDLLHTQGGKAAKLSLVCGFDKYLLQPVCS